MSPASGRSCPKLPDDGASTPPQLLSQAIASVKMLTLVTEALDGLSWQCTASELLELPPTVQLDSPAEVAMRLRACAGVLDAVSASLQRSAATWEVRGHAVDAF